MRMVVAAGDTQSGDSRDRIGGALSGPDPRCGVRPRGWCPGPCEQFNRTLQGRLHFGGTPFRFASAKWQEVGLSWEVGVGRQLARSPCVPALTSGKEVRLR
jgi:hypothetical protein